MTQRIGEPHSKLDIPVDEPLASDAPRVRPAPPADSREGTATLAAGGPPLRPIPAPPAKRPPAQSSPAEPPPAQGSPAEPPPPGSRDQAATLSAGTSPRSSPTPRSLPDATSQRCSSRRWDVTLLPFVEREHYTIEGEFAKGGIGRILLARDSRLDRTVALKELLVMRGEEADRFVREVRITARLQHPSIVPVYEAGRWPSGEPFYAMRLVSGRSFELLIAERATIEQRLELLPHVLAAVEAVAYAHSQGIIHRDLKPTNIVVGAFGETVVIDWGLAKDLREKGDIAPPPAVDSPQERDKAAPTSSHPGGQPSSQDEALTMLGAIMGTPMYMPPEQAWGHTVDERADVYALGAILYQVLAGARPYQGTYAIEVLKEVRAGPPPALSQRQRGIPLELLAIVNKAMARDPHQRYPTAAALAEDLRRFQNGQIVDAHRYSRSERLRRFIRRHRGAVSVAAAALAGMVLAGVLSFRRVIVERDRADARADELTLTQARAAVEQDPNQALAWLKSLSPRFPRTDAVRMIAADAKARGISVVLRGHSASVNGIAFSPDGSTLATTGDDHTLRLWNLASGKGRVFAECPDEVWRVAFSPDGKRIAASSKDNRLRLWDLATGTVRVLSEHSSFIPSFRFSPDGRLLASAGADGSLWIWDVVSDARFALRGHTAGLWRTAFSPDGKRIASTSADRTVRLWDLATREARVFSGHSAPVVWIDFSPDGRLLASASEDTTVRVWEVESGESRVLTGHTGEVRMVAFSPDGRTLASSGTDRTVRLWDPATGASRVLVGHEGRIWSFAFSPDGKRLASASADRTVRLWNLEHGEGRPLRGFHDVAFDVAFSPDGASIAASSWDTTARIFPVEISEGRSLAGHAAAVEDVVFSPDGEQLASASDDGTARLWPLIDGAPLILEGHQGRVSRVLFSPSGRLLASAGDDGTVRLWDRQGNAAGSFQNHEGVVTSIGFSPSGRMLVSGGVDGRVALMDVETGQVQIFSGPATGVTGLAFSADGRQLAATGNDGRVWIWDIDSQEARVFRGHRGVAQAVAFSPHGDSLASGGTDHMIRFWDRERGELRQIEAGGYGISQLAFTPDGEMLLSLGSTWSNGVRLWDAATGAARSTLVSHGESLNRFTLSPDGSRLATVSVDSMIRLWDLRSGESRSLYGHTDGILAVAFSPDGRMIASASKDRTVRLWFDDLPQEPGALRAWLDAATPDTIEQRATSLTPR